MEELKKEDEDEEAEKEGGRVGKEIFNEVGKRIKQEEEEEESERKKRIRLSTIRLSKRITIIKISLYTLP